MTNTSTEVMKEIMENLDVPDNYGDYEKALCFVDKISNEVLEGLDRKAVGSILMSMATKQFRDAGLFEEGIETTQGVMTVLIEDQDRLRVATEK